MATISENLKNSAPELKRPKFRRRKQRRQNLSAVTSAPKFSAIRKPHAKIKPSARLRSTRMRELWRPFRKISTENLKNSAPFSAADMLAKASIFRTISFPTENSALKLKRSNHRRRKQRHPNLSAVTSVPKFSAIRKQYAKIKPSTRLRSTRVRELWRLFRKILAENPKNSAPFSAADIPAKAPIFCGIRFPLMPENSQFRIKRSKFERDWKIRLFEKKKSKFERDSFNLRIFRHSENNTRKWSRHRGFNLSVRAKFRATISENFREKLEKFGSIFRRGHSNECPNFPPHNTFSTSAGKFGASNETAQLRARFLRPPKLSAVQKQNTKMKPSSSLRPIRTREVSRENFSGKPKKFGSVFRREDSNGNPNFSNNTFSTSAGKFGPSNKTDRTAA